jgi:PAS domain S-box-containing protein
MSSSSADPEPSRADEFRWQKFFQQAGEPVFVLNRRSRLVFVNRAWEACTGLRFSQVRGLSCRRRARPADEDQEEAVRAALAPPTETLHGEASQVRRRAPGAAETWWQINFMPLRGEGGLLGILGRITVIAQLASAAFALPEKLLSLRDRKAAEFQLDALVSELPALERVKDQARLAAGNRRPVTLVGETGSGKHWLARAIHNAGSERHQSFGSLDCSRLPAGAVAETLFGWGKTRLQFGTIYCREPAALPRELQERIAQHANTESPSRFIVGYSTDPSEQVRSGRLLGDLHHALGTQTIALPPLRERIPDLPWLAEQLLKRAGAIHEQAPKALSAEAMALLRSYSWPGNLRELNDVLQSATGRAKSERIEVVDVPFHLRHGPVPAEKKFPLDALLEQAERRLIVLALRLADNNRAQAARLLDVWRPRLLRRMEHFGIDVPDRKESPEA